MVQLQLSMEQKHLKYRKNEPKTTQTSSSPLGDPSRILFLSDRKEGRIAQLLFDPEARKMEVYWIASAFCLDQNAAHSGFTKDDPEGTPFSELLNRAGIESPADLNEAPPVVTTDDLQNAKLLVFVQTTASSDYADLFAKTFPSYKGETENWTVPADENSVDSLLQNVKSLLVRLILKGGKRAPVPLPPTPTAIKPSGPQKSVRVRLESKGRAGKKVTVVFGLEMDSLDLDDLATSLKQTCGTGGTVKDGTIEIQGDQCDRVLAELKRRGMQAKRSGG